MSDTQAICTQCGAPLTDDAPRGLCPECLLKAGLPTETGILEPTPAAPGPPPSPEELAEQFPDLEILELLGQGGMGVVYKARQKRLDRLVALKILAAELEKTPGFAERFTREAQALARFSHPNIVAVFDFGQTQAGRYYLLMEFVDGANLREVIRTGRVSPAEALAIVPQICDALQFAHQAGIVHRDIKPENILLDQAGQVKIADFGLAKMLQRSTDLLTLTQAGARMGTMRYMAPEQLDEPEHVDHRADIYSLGVVFYELLTGEVPMGRFEPPSHRAQVDVRLDEVVLRSLEREPERRYQSADAVRTELRTIAEQPPPPPAAKPAGKKRTAKPPAAPAGQLQKVAGWLTLVGFLSGVPTALHLLRNIGLFSTGNGFGGLLEPVVHGLLAAGCLLAALHMRDRRSLDVAVAGCMLAIIPMAPPSAIPPFIFLASVLGLVAGIWGLALLSRKEVRDQFTEPRHPKATFWLKVVLVAGAIALLTAGSSNLRSLWQIGSIVAAGAALNLARKTGGAETAPAASAPAAA